MSRNTPGQFHDVIRGDRIRRIANTTYGFDNSSDIVKANEQLLKGRAISLENLPVIYHGDRLWLPILQEEKEDETIPAENNDEIAIRIDGKIFRGWTVNSIERSINSIADSFSFTAPFDYNDPESVYLDPFTYHETDLFIGGKPYIYGRSEGYSFSLNEDSTMVTISCRSKTGVIIDCTSPEKTLNFTGQTLQKIADIILKPFGIKTSFPYGDTDAFAKTKRNLTDQVFSFLQGLASKKAVIINSDRKDGIQFDQANVDGEPILNLIQGEQPLIGGVKADYDGTQRFSEYTAVGQSAGNPTNNSSVKDDTIPIFRPIIFSANDTKQGDIATSAEWERNRALSRSAKVSCTVSGWRDKNDELIYENEIVTLYCPNVAIFNETKFLIEKVSLSKQQGGRVANLTLVLPESYTSEFPEGDLPWQR